MGWPWMSGAQVRVGAQSLILAAGQSRGDDAAHSGGVQLDLGAEESARGVRRGRMLRRQRGRGLSHSAKQGRDVPNFEASFQGRRRQVQQGPQ